MYQKLIHTAMASCAKICIVPIQDWLGLDNSARMNVPGSVDANWCWRLQPELLT
jgi:4-alpha-glucanotransferase